MSETLATVERPPPVGEHRREILAEYGIAAAQVAALKADGDVTVASAR